MACPFSSLAEASGTISIFLIIKELFGSLPVGTPPQQPYIIGPKSICIPLACLSPSPNKNLLRPSVLNSSNEISSIPSSLSKILSLISPFRYTIISFIPLLPV